MNSMTSGYSARDPAGSHNWNGLHYWVIFAFSFPVFFAAAVGLRLTPAFWLGATPHKSIVAEAWSAAGTTARFAFSG